jgi:hypothetical protein
MVLRILASIPLVSVPYRRRSEFRERWTDRARHRGTTPWTALPFDRQVSEKVLQAFRRASEKARAEAIDEPVPMLGNITPRRAARSAKGREQLVTWLKMLENGAARQGRPSVAGYDATWMWEELGIAELRR